MGFRKRKGLLDDDTLTAGRGRGGWTMYTLIVYGVRQNSTYGIKLDIDSIQLKMYRVLLTFLEWVAVS